MVMGLQIDLFILFSFIQVNVTNYPQWLNAYTIKIDLFKYPPLQKKQVAELEVILLGSENKWFKSIDLNRFTNIYMVTLIEHFYN